MSEKRFKLGDLDIGAYRNIIDTKTDKEYTCVFACALLNEQQELIKSLQAELELTGNTKLFSRRELERKVKEQAETIRKQSIRIYCQDKEVQRLLGELEKIPKNIREVWLE